MFALLLLDPLSLYCCVDFDTSCHELLLWVILILSSLLQWIAVLPHPVSPSLLKVLSFILSLILSLSLSGTVVITTESGWLFLA